MTGANPRIVRLAAGDAYKAGCSIVPVTNDGAKRPALREWRQFRERQPTKDEARAMFPPTDGPVGLGILAAARFLCWDFDCPETHAAFVEAAHATGLGALVDRIAAGYCDRTPSGGTRWIVRTDQPIDRERHNPKLARRPTRDDERQHEHDRVRVLIELPDHAIVAPSHGGVHPSGKPYVRVSGGFATIATLTVAEELALERLARTFDTMPAPEPVRHVAPAPTHGTRPGDEYNARTSWPALLEPHGWTAIFQRGDVTHWRRPGKAEGTSATTNVGNSDLLYVFSSSTPFEPEHSYTKFGVYAVLVHGGDHTAAARTLAASGYGEPREPRPPSTIPCRDSNAQDSGNGAPTAEPVEALLDRVGLTGALSAATVEPVIRTLAAALAGADALRLATVREAATGRLKAAGIKAPGKLLTAGLDRGKAGDESPAAPFEAVEPWPDPVDGAALATTLVATVRRYVALSEEQALVVGLWLLHTWTYETAHVSPILLITSATKRAGKTTLIDVLAGLGQRAVPAANITAAALFRSIEKWRPTLLIDEADTFLRDNVELRGVLNAGYRRGGTVIRTTGDHHEPTTFAVFGAKAIAMIGMPYDTLIDRALPVRLQRKMSADRIERFRYRPFAALARPLRQQMGRWAADQGEALTDAEPAIPDGLHDRAADNITPLLAIADVLGGAWPEQARAALLTLHASQDDDGHDLGELLLQDLRALFGDADRLTTAEILTSLNAMDERPWPAQGHGKGLTGHRMSRLLKPFGVVAAQARKTGEDKARGYNRASFEGAWRRYPPLKVGQWDAANESGAKLTFQSGTVDEGCPTLKMPVRPMNPGSRPTVPLSTPHDGEETF